MEFIIKAKDLCTKYFFNILTFINKNNIIKFFFSTALIFPDRHNFL